jgi:hypothetical protein
VLLQQVLLLLQLFLQLLLLLLRCQVEVLHVCLGLLQLCPAMRVLLHRDLEHWLLPLPIPLVVLPPAMLP